LRTAWRAPKIWHHPLCLGASSPKFWSAARASSHKFRSAVVDAVTRLDDDVLQHFSQPSPTPQTAGLVKKLEQCAAPLNQPTDSGHQAGDRIQESLDVVDRVFDLLNLLDRTPDLVVNPLELLGGVLKSRRIVVENLLTQ
jgi:hypothetical protein